MQGCMASGAIGLHSEVSRRRIPRSNCVGTVRQAEAGTADRSMGTCKVVQKDKSKQQVQVGPPNLLCLCSPLPGQPSMIAMMLRHQWRSRLHAGHGHSGTRSWALAKCQEEQVKQQEQDVTTDQSEPLFAPLQPACRDLLDATPEVKESAAHFVEHAQPSLASDQCPIACTRPRSGKVFVDSKGLANLTF